MDKKQVSNYFEANIDIIDWLLEPNYLKYFSNSSYLKPYFSNIRIHTDTYFKVQLRILKYVCLILLQSSLLLFDTASDVTA